MTGRPRALVEADRHMDEELLERLLAATYRASARRPSAVLLRDLAPAEADRLLDPVVQARGPDVAGIVYLAGEEEDAFLGAASGADVVVATGRLRERLASRGVRAVGPARGIRALRSSAAAPTSADDREAPSTTTVATSRQLTQKTGTG